MFPSAPSSPVLPSHLPRVGWSTLSLHADDACTRHLHRYLQEELCTLQGGKQVPQVGDVPVGPGLHGRPPHHAAIPVVVEERGLLDSGNGLQSPSYHALHGIYQKLRSIWSLSPFGMPADPREQAHPTNTSAPPGALASASVAPSPTMTTRWRPRVARRCWTASRLPPEREVKQVGSKPA